MMYKMSPSFLKEASGLFMKLEMDEVDLIATVQTYKEEMRMLF